MKQVSGKFSIVKENKAVPYCTVSSELFKGISVFSIAKGTDISAECYSSKKLWYVLSGAAEVFGNGKDSVKLDTGDIFTTPVDKPIGIRTIDGCIYLEISGMEENEMNEVLKAEQVFKLKDLVPYQDGKIVNMDIVNNDKMKFMIMSFGAGTGLSEHSAPGEALIFALDGEVIIGYEGKEYTLKAGENFKFDKMGKHFVKADKNFKMALLLELGE